MNLRRLILHYRSARATACSHGWLDQVQALVSDAGGWVTTKPDESGRCNLFELHKGFVSIGVIHVGEARRDHSGTVAPYQSELGERVLALWKRANRRSDRKGRIGRLLRARLEEHGVRGDRPEDIAVALLVSGALEEQREVGP